MLNTTKFRRFLLGLLLMLGCCISATSAFDRSDELVAATVDSYIPETVSRRVTLLKATQMAKRQHISGDSIRMLRMLSYHVLLYIPKQYLTDVVAVRRLVEDAIDKKILKFDKWDFSGEEPWDEEQWLSIFNRFNQTSELFNRLSELRSIETKDALQLETLPQLAHDARSILHSFLPTDEHDIMLLEGQSFKKRHLLRLFTYADLERVISQKGLAHIDLPLKLLVIKNIKTGNYVLGKAAEAILDESIDFYLQADGRVTINYDDSRHSDYECYILAHAQQLYRDVPFSRATLEDLNTLVSEAPFDVGYDNIFSKSDGTAVIVDTEFKGEPARHSLLKLARYHR